MSDQTSRENHRIKTVYDNRVPSDPKYKPAVSVVFENDEKASSKNAADWDVLLKSKDQTLSLQLTRGDYNGKAWCRIDAVLGGGQAVQVPAPVGPTAGGNAGNGVGVAGFGLTPKDRDIHRQVALKAAIELVGRRKEIPVGNIEPYTTYFEQFLNSGRFPHSPAADEPTTTRTPNDDDPPPF